MHMSNNSIINFTIVNTVRALFPFGEMIGDTLAPPEDDAAFGPNLIEIPVVFFQSNETEFYVCITRILLYSLLHIFLYLYIGVY